jgi:hypothetical protein
MAKAKRLKLTLKNIKTDREWKHQSKPVIADPDDHAALRKHIDAMARDLDRRTGTGWLADYVLKVEYVDERGTFTVAGAN